MSNTSKQMKSIEFEYDGIIGETRSGAFAVSEVVVTEGRTLDELIDNAIIYMQDQDGGNAGELEIDEVEQSSYNWIANHIREIAEEMDAHDQMFIGSYINANTEEG